MSEAALIYNLFPLLIGPIPRWEDHLDRIAAMGFTWIYLNPIHPPGLSGSLYAVRDYFGVNPLFHPENGGDPEAALRRYLKAASRRGLRVMLDLVINHTAIDSPLTTEQPHWYARDAAGRIKHPGAIDPADATKVTVWGDLAELEYWPVPDPDGLSAYWRRVLEYYLDLGFQGFRADAAYKIPGWFWERLIASARGYSPEVRFFAETLGCRLEECSQLATAGFDFLYNSSKWWDFQEDWCLEQYARFRRLAPSVSFPESHDTERLAAETGADQGVARQRYLFAAVFSSGLMMPVGYEYGFRKKLHVVETRPEDWEEPGYDLTDFVTRVNRLKRDCPVLLEEGPQVRLSPRGEPVVLLLKSRDRGPGRVLTIINASAENQLAKLPKLSRLLGPPSSAWRELTPGAPYTELMVDREFPLAGSQVRLLWNPQATPLPPEEESFQPAEGPEPEGGRGKGA
ncbi:MAG: alpha-amylase [Deltaproteobacteria bacterium]|nr:alpha-amylase [Deltaproteobacteria bacterium]